MNGYFIVEEIPGKLIKITNNTDCNLLLSRIPIPPKRKIIDITLINPGGFIIFDLRCDDRVNFMDGTEFDLSRISFTLQPTGGDV